MATIDQGRFGPTPAPRPVADAMDQQQCPHLTSWLASTPLTGSEHYVVRLQPQGDATGCRLERPERVDPAGDRVGLAPSAVSDASGDERVDACRPVEPVDRRDGRLDGQEARRPQVGAGRQRVATLVGRVPEGRRDVDVGAVADDGPRAGRDRWVRSRIASNALVARPSAMGPSAGAMRPPGPRR